MYSVDFQFLLQLVQLGGVSTEYQHLFLDPSENEVTGQTATQVAGRQTADAGMQSHSLPTGEASGARSRRNLRAVTESLLKAECD